MTVLLWAELISVVGAHEEGVPQPTQPQVDLRYLSPPAFTILQSYERDAHCVTQQLMVLAIRESREQVVIVMQEIIST